MNFRFPGVVTIIDWIVGWLLSVFVYIMKSVVMSLFCDMRVMHS